LSWRGPGVVGRCGAEAQGFDAAEMKAPLFDHENARTRDAKVDVTATCIDVEATLREWKSAGRDANGDARRKHLIDGLIVLTTVAFRDGMTLSTSAWPEPLALRQAGPPARRIRGNTSPAVRAKWMVPPRGVPPLLRAAGVVPFLMPRLGQFKTNVPRLAMTTPAVDSPRAQRPQEAHARSKRPRTTPRVVHSPLASRRRTICAA
jgi:hypothetical protein